MVYKRNRPWVPTDRTYLGGLTLPFLTRRPHMGPFNRVSPIKLSDADEVYRQHDIGYGRERAAGRNPYLTWNKYDSDLLNAPVYGPVDYVAKAAFGIKSALIGGSGLMPRIGATRTSGAPYRPRPTEPGSSSSTSVPSRRGKIRSRIRYEKW